MMTAYSSVGPGSPPPLQLHVADAPTDVGEPPPLTGDYLRELAVRRLRPDQPRIYVSFRGGADERLARRIALKLSARFGEGSVVLGGDLARSARPTLDARLRALDPCWVVVAVLGPEWHTYPHPATPRIGDVHDPVRQELERALALRAAGGEPTLPFVVPVLRERVDVEELARVMPPSLRPVLDDAGLSEPERGWTATEDLKLEARIQRLIAPLIERSTATTRPSAPAPTGSRLLVGAIVAAVLALIAAGALFAFGMRHVPATTGAASIATSAAPSSVTAALPGDLGAAGGCDAHPYDCLARDLGQIRARLDEIGQPTPVVAAADPVWDAERVDRLLAAVGRIETTLHDAKPGSTDAVALRRLSRELAGLRADVGEALTTPSAPVVAPPVQAPAPVEAPTAEVVAPTAAPVVAQPRRPDPEARWDAQVVAITATVCGSGARSCRSQVAGALSASKAAALRCLDDGGRDALQAVKGGGTAIAELPRGYRLVCR